MEKGFYWLKNQEGELFVGEYDPDWPCFWICGSDEPYKPNEFIVGPPISQEGGVGGEVKFECVG